MCLFAGGPLRPKSAPPGNPSDFRGNMRLARGPRSGRPGDNWGKAEMNTAAAIALTRPLAVASLLCGYGSIAHLSGFVSYSVPRHTPRMS